MRGCVIPVALMHLSLSLFHTSKEVYRIDMAVS